MTSSRQLTYEATASTLESLPRLVYLARQEAGLTQSTVALQLGVAQSVVSRVERGQLAKLGLPTVIALVRWLAANEEGTRSDDA